MLHTMAASMLFVLSFATFTMAQSAEVGGTWNVTMNIPGSEPRKFPLVLKQEGGNLSASVGPSAATGTVKGNDVTLKYTVKFQDNDLPITMTGKVAGNEIKGDVDFGGMAQETWTATRGEVATAAAPAPATALAANTPAAPASGAIWNLIYTSPVGEFPVILTVQQEGENISGIAGHERPKRSESSL